MADECTIWTLELADDSIKQLWRSDQAYRDSNRAEAIALLQSQVSERIPLIEGKARSECESQRLCYDVAPLKKDLEGVLVKMRLGRPYKEVNDAVFEIDKRYAVPSYEAFCSCSRK